MNLVIDIATSRVVFFSDREVVAAEKTVVATYRGEIPEGMTEKNCWNWKLIGAELVKSTAPFQADINKKALIASITSRCDAEHKKLKDAAFIAEVAEELSGVKPETTLKFMSVATGKSVDALKAEYENILEDHKRAVIIIEFIRNRFLTAASYCESVEEVESIKQSFNEATFTWEYITSADRELIEVIDTNVLVDFMLREVNDRELNWDVSTDRQEQIYVQKDTQSIPLVSGVPIEGKLWPSNLWDSLLFQQTALYNQYPAIITWLNDYAAANNLLIARIAIVKLKVGGEVGSHIDVGEYYRAYQRYHLCLDGSYEYSVLGKTETINKGTLLRFDNKNVHYSRNVGDVPRIAIIFDAKKF